VDPILLLLVVFAVMMIPMLLMSNRQKKAQRQQVERLSQLGVGDEVRTHSGFYGIIVEEFGDTVILESESGAQLKWARAAISMKVEPTEESSVVEGEAVEPDGAVDVDAAPGQTVRDERDIPGVTSQDTDRR